MQDLLEAGFDTDMEHLMLAWEQPGWGKEKASRRSHIAATHRVIMLFGDDLSDFVICARENPVAPLLNSCDGRESKFCGERKHPLLGRRLVHPAEPDARFVDCLPLKPAPSSVFLALKQRML